MRRARPYILNAAGPTQCGRSKILRLVLQNAVAHSLENELILLRMGSFRHSLDRLIQAHSGSSGTRDAQWGRRPSGGSIRVTLM